MLKVVAICDHLVFLGCRKLEHEINRETCKITFYLFVQPPGFNSVKFSQIAIEHHFLAPN